MEEHGGPVRVGSERENKHSRLGIWSFILAILATLLLVVAFVIIFAVGSQFAEGANPQGLSQQEVQQFFENSPGSGVALVVAVVGLLASPLLYLLGAILGIAGVVQGRRKRLFAVIGLVLNGLAFLAIAGFFVLTLVGAAAVGPPA